MTKFSKTHAKQMKEFMDIMDGSGCLTVDQWTSGSGRHTTNRALPPFVTRFEREKLDTFINQNGNWRCRAPKGSAEYTAWKFFVKPENGRRKAVLVMDKEAAFRFLFECAHGEEF